MILTLDRPFVDELLGLLKAHEQYQIAVDVQQSARSLRPFVDDRASLLTRETQALRAELEQRLMAAIATPGSK